MDKPTISKLFSDAAKLLRAEFEFARSSNPIPGEKGAEIESVLKSFLNSHLPQRFRAGSGIIIDNENNMSKQTDVIIYDALSSPIYRASEKTQIVPVDSVGCVIEVKTCLNKNEMRDSFEKIASCKQLKKRPLSQLDQRTTGSGLITIGTLGVIFGFDSDTSLEALADNVAELNKEYKSELWPNMVVVLDKGVINYAVGFPGDHKLAGDLAPPCGDNFQIPPFYVHLIIRRDDEFSLNRFFCSLLSHLTFYPRRPSTPPFDVMLEGTPKEAMTITAYQYNRKRELKPVPPQLYHENNPPSPLSMSINDRTGQQIGLMQFIPWQDGAVIRWYGAIPLEVLLALFLPQQEGIVVHHPSSPVQLSSVLAITEEEFGRWPSVLAEKSDMSAVLEEK